MSITNYNGSSINNVSGVVGGISSLFSPNNTNIKSAKQLIAEEKEREQERLNNYVKMFKIEKTQKDNDEKKRNKPASKRRLKNDEDKYKPKFLDQVKSFWNKYSAEKRGDTLLIHFGHKPKKGDKAIQTCDELKKKKYDERYGKFYCIDTETHEKKDPEEILEDLKNIYEGAKKDGIKTIKFYLDGHGSIDDFFSLEFSMEEFLQSLDFLDEKYNDMNFLFVKTPCFDGDNNDFYKFYWEEIIRDFSLKHPNSKIIAQEHADKTSAHWTTEKAFSRNHYRFKYYLWQNGTKTEIDKDDKKIFGGTYEKSEEFNDLKANAWSLMFALLSSLVAGVALSGTTYGIRECVKKCNKKENDMENHNNSEVNIINSESKITGNNNDIPKRDCCSVKTDIPDGMKRGMDIDSSVNNKGRVNNLSNSIKVAGKIDKIK